MVETEVEPDTRRRFRFNVPIPRPISPSSIQFNIIRSAAKSLISSVRAGRRKINQVSLESESSTMTPSPKLTPPGAQVGDDGGSSPEGTNTPTNMHYHTGIIDSEADYSAFIASLTGQQQQQGNGHGGESGQAGSPESTSARAGLGDGQGLSDTGGLQTQTQDTRASSDAASQFSDDASHGTESLKTSRISGSLRRHLKKNPPSGSANNKDRRKDSKDSSNDRNVSDASGTQGRDPINRNPSGTNQVGQNPSNQLDSQEDSKPSASTRTGGNNPSGSPGDDLSTVFMNMIATMMVDSSRGDHDIVQDLIYKINNLKNFYDTKSVPPPQKTFMENLGLYSSSDPHANKVPADATRVPSNPFFAKNLSMCPSDKATRSMRDADERYDVHESDTGLINIFCAFVEGFEETLPSLHISLHHAYLIGAGLR